ncbi:CDP-diacylglycerol--serine O-phosphatidyltransferase [Sinobacterium caligoides]|uniref:CDP-diacylglycerol--serine O-phosphatidyltransferase n=1 Tax=Sinobacterium caligoides TaxID=933926 RepID=A0A3N2DG40_9GAMM|nr:CDP-diacylglycerol--serine O-phosphatidyltransferase [Sinobacterium caligoides]ROR98618.1 CDP-diacylglycerol--serine O-phosphatidyltransferase [Sinobacterium caligoides]
MSETENSKIQSDDASSSRSEIDRLPIDEHIEEVQENGKKVPKKGIYLLPNLFTMAALFSGFYAIIAAMNSNYEAAAIAIFVAMLLDGLDGRVARMTNTQSAFGAELDSLSDMVSFGVAPGLVVFTWGLAPLGRWGWAAAFIYIACAAIRLARFNTQIDTADKRYFTGLASPAAAALIAGLVWVCHNYGIEKEAVPLALSIITAMATVLAGLLMVTNVPYHSFKGIDFHGRVPFIVFLAIPLIFAIIVVDPAVVLMVIFSVYALSGPFQWLFGRRLK